MTDASPIRVVVVDDHEMVLDSVVRALDRETDISVVATATTVASGLARVGQWRPDVVVMDYQLPDGDGVSAARHIVDTWPEMCVVLLTGSNRDEAVFEAARAGCAGYVDKARAPAELVRVVRSVHTGARELPDQVLGRLPHLDDLVVHYQPIVNLVTEQVVGHEALVRWSHPDRGLVPPAEFIGLAEQTSLIVDIDERVRQVACRQAKEWNVHVPTAPPRFMSVNVSGRELQDPDLAVRIDDVLTASGLAPDSLMLEVTETFLVTDDDVTTRRLHELKELGVRIALDDFGTAYSSLGYLRRFPIDVIKLDKSFTDGLPHGERELQLLDSVRRLAADMGALAEAEGIETAEQAACLRGLGWEFGQGYYFSRPVEADAAAATLGRSTQR